MRRREGSVGDPYPLVQTKLSHHCKLGFLTKPVENLGFTTSVLIRDIAPRVIRRTCYNKHECRWFLSGSIQYLEYISFISIGSYLGGEYQ